MVNHHPRGGDRSTAEETQNATYRLSCKAAAAELAAVLGGMAETARELAYRLYTICERKKRAQEALSYNALVQSWPEIMRLAREGVKARPQQAEPMGFVKVPRIVGSQSGAVF